MKKYIIPAAAAVVMIGMQASMHRMEPADKAALGKLLFFDPILSRDSTVSCATCHLPAYAFADTAAVSTGIGGRQGVRNAPSAMNLSMQKSFFWDGRAASLEAQALGPIADTAEMGLPVTTALHRLRSSNTYNRYFRKIFNREPDSASLGAAIAAFERTLETSNSPFDNWKFSDDSTAVSEMAQRGFVIFNGKGKCVRCHFGPDFTTREFHNIGLFNGKNLNDSGRALISGKPEDAGKFKTPGLRNVAVTAPYMHNGLFRTLQEVIDFYNEPAILVPDAIGRDTILARPLGLTPQEKTDLLAFLVALTDKRFHLPAANVSRPRVAGW